MTDRDRIIEAHPDWRSIFREAKAKCDRLSEPHYIITTRAIRDRLIAWWEEADHE